MTTLTVEYLTNHKACQDGIDFALRNCLIGFPLNQLDAIEGDYENYVKWLRKRLKNIYDYDDRGNWLKQFPRMG